MNVSQKIDKLIEESLGEHLKNNWGKYATGLGALGAGVAANHFLNDPDSQITSTAIKQSLQHGDTIGDKLYGAGRSLQAGVESKIDQFGEHMGIENAKNHTGHIAAGLGAGLGTLGLAGYGAKKLADKRR
jgi:hypothetical protein